MFKKLRILAFILVLIFPTDKMFAQDVPVIVISPGKTPQSFDEVGSSVTIIDGNQIEGSSSYSISEIIGSNTTSANWFQAGGEGTNTGIQLRGLEKRYSTVYVDGVKMSDPSSSDNSFYLENIMKDSIERIEILKGTQSALYGSNAIGGTINIITKKGKNGNHSNIKLERGSNNTKNVFYSVDGADEKINYFLGLNRFLTSGVSAMNHNDEDDKYRNEGITGKFSYKFNENFKIENSLRYTNSDVKYDEPNDGTTDLNNRSDNIEGTYSLKLSHDKNKFKNTLSYNTTYVERAVTSATNTYTNYFGFRDNFGLLGEYNFNLDNKVVYGIEAEFDEARYPGDYAPSNRNWTKSLFDKRADEHIISQYFDYQFRPLENLYATIGFRSDEHSIVGRKPSGRTTLAYKLDQKSKIRSSWGAGIRFPSLYDYHFADGNTPSSGGGSESGDGYQGISLEDLKAERGISYDIGYDTYIDNMDVGLSLTYFNVEQKNPLSSDARNNWKMQNVSGTNTSEGIELSADWKPESKKIGVSFDYTFTDSFDSNTCEVKNNSCSSIVGSKLAKAKVRVPRHGFSSTISHNIIPNLKNSLSIRFVDEVRDFGNTNNGFKDVILEDWITFNASSEYKLFNSYKVYFNAINIFDDVYETAYQYGSMERSFNFGIRRTY
jgi:vitamin B12 transporter